MAFPLLVFLLGAGAVGGTYYLVTKDKKKNSPEHTRDGVHYGANCSSVNVANPAAWMKAAMPKMIALAKSIKPSDDAIEAVARIQRVAMPDCPWSTDGVPDTLMIGPQQSIHWSVILGMLRGKTLQQAAEDGTLDKFATGQQMSSGSRTVDFLRGIFG